MDDEHWCFRADTLSISPDVTVQHRVAENQDFRMAQLDVEGIEHLRFIPLGVINANGFFVRFAWLKITDGASVLRLMFYHLSD